MNRLTTELEQDIRDKVNPQYADMKGMESYERKALLDEIDRLRVTNDGLYLGLWIDAKKTTPPLINGKDYSKNVWGWDGHNILIVSFFVDADGWHWANAYGDVWGEAEFDDDYDIQYWQPIKIPSPPSF